MFAGVKECLERLRASETRGPKSVLSVLEELGEVARNGDRSLLRKQVSKVHQDLKEIYYNGVLTLRYGTDRPEEVTSESGQVIYKYPRKSFQKDGWQLFQDEEIRCTGDRLQACSVETKTMILEGGAMISSRVSVGGSRDGRRVDYACFERSGSGLKTGDISCVRVTFFCGHVSIGEMKILENDGDLSRVHKFPLVYTI